MSDAMLGRPQYAAYNAISPRFAMRTEVSDLGVGAAVELQRMPLGASSWRER